MNLGDYKQLMTYNNGDIPYYLMKVFLILKDNEDYTQLFSYVISAALN